MKLCFEQVRNEAPLVHNITNYVTVNDVANVLLACGASPIMSDAPQEVEEITTLCGGLTLNLGTLHPHSLEAIMLAGTKAKALCHPLIFAPVASGARRVLV